MSDTDMLYMASLEKRNAELEARIAELEDKHWNECRQIAHYDDELSKYQKEMPKIVEYIDYLRSLPANRWISVKERLPEIGKSVLIHYPKWDGDEIQVAKLEGDGMAFDICGEFDIGAGAVTYWMPLPESPRGGDAE